VRVETGRWMEAVFATNQVHRVATVGASRERRCQRWRARTGLIVAAVAAALVTPGMLAPAFF
jgi:hypothetical protein